MKRQLECSEPLRVTFENDRAQLLLFGRWQKADALTMLDLVRDTCRRIVLQLARWNPSPLRFGHEYATQA